MRVMHMVTMATWWPRVGEVGVYACDRHAHAGHWTQGVRGSSQPPACMWNACSGIVQTPLGWHAYATCPHRVVMKTNAVRL